MNIYQTYEPSQIRELIRKKEITGPTAGLAEGYAQANLMIVKKNLPLIFCCFVSAIPLHAPCLMYWSRVIQCRDGQHPKRIFVRTFLNTVFTEKGFFKKRCQISLLIGRMIWLPFSSAAVLRLSMRSC